jgi:alanine racemase
MNIARIWTEVDPSAIRHNAEFALRQTGDAAGLMAVVKANAYGHGVACAVDALRDVATLFAVSNVEEAAAVRELAPEKDIALLSPCLPAERRECVARGFIATASSADEARAFAECAEAGKPARVQLKVDTGMGRIGVWKDDALREIEEIVRTPRLALHSAATHLPCADEDDDFTRAQLADFAEFSAAAHLLAPDAKVHALNSAGVCGYPEFAFDFIRPGLMLYGSTTVGGFQSRLRPALAWKTRVLLVRDVPAGRGVSYGRTFVTPRAMRIATLAAGYADGYPRQASGRGACVLVGGKRCPVLGRVTMDQILVDVSEAGEVQPGDEAVLIGSQGKAEILAGELAEWAGTIAWHVFTGIGGRTKRVVLAPDSQTS